MKPLRREVNRRYKDIDLDLIVHPHTNDLVGRYDDEALTGSIINIIRTRRGERVFNPDFGSNIYSSYVDRQPVAAARLFERNQAAVHAGDDLGLAADHPPPSAGRRKVVDGHRDAAGAQRFVAGGEPLALQMAALGAAGRACLVFCHRFMWSL